MRRSKVLHPQQVKKTNSFFFRLELNMIILILSGFVYAGMGPDFRVLVSSARKNAQKYYLTYREIQPVSQVVKESALLMQEYTQSGGVRPFGASLLVAGYDDEGPQLFQVDPSGAAFGWKATAIGKNYVNANNFLERRYNDDVEIDDAVRIINISSISSNSLFSFCTFFLVYYSNRCTLHCLHFERVTKER